MTGLDAKDARYEHHMLESALGAAVEQPGQRDAAETHAALHRSLARAAATRVLCYWRERVADPLALLKVQVNDPHPAVRLEAVRAASFFQTSEAAGSRWNR